MSLERNIHLYPFYQLSRNLLFWMPVFFLYFSSLFPIDEVLLLAALYYASFVVLEVPSGYLSDRLGRRPTLIVGAAAAFVGSVLFVVTDTFHAFIVAQCMYSVGMAFNSGSDTALLFESLKSSGKSDEIVRHEARAHSFSFAALGAAALIGGIVAGFDLRLAYALTAVAGVVTVGICWCFVEPPAEDRLAHPPLAQFAVVMRRARDPALRWLIVFAIAIIVLEHVPYEFLQPYLDELFGDLTSGTYASTPVVAGVMVAATMGFAALASRHTESILGRLGLAKSLIVGLSAIIVLIAAMGSVLHVSFLLLFAMRSVPSAFMKPMLLAVAHPRLESGIRATFLSVQSLAGRLAFSFTLAGAAYWVGDVSHLDWDDLSTILLGYAAGAAVLLPVLFIGAHRLARLEAQRVVS